MSIHTTREKLLADAEVRKSIAERAYFKAVHEGFVHGRHLLHWIEAEGEIVEKLLTNTKTNGSAAPKAAAKPKATASAAKPAAAKTAPVKPAPVKPAAAKTAAAAKPAAKRAK